MFNVNVSIAMDSDQLRKVLFQQTENIRVDRRASDESEYLDPEVEDAFQAWWKSSEKVQTEMIKPCDGQKLRPFVAGELVFYPTRVELCSVKICDGVDSGLRRKILEVLKCKRSNGNFIALSGDELREKIDAVDVNTVAAVIRKLRQDIMKRLREIGIECGSEDVLLSGGPGYRLIETITIREVGAFELDSKLVCASIQNAGPKTSDKKQDIPRVENERQQWILKELQLGKGLRLARITEEFDCSMRTAKRDIESLRSFYKISFYGSQKTGEYKLDRASVNRHANTI